MRTPIPIIGLIVIGTLLIACSRNADREPDLVNFGRQASPDEFGIVPSQQIVIPDRIGALPEPLPGGGNRVDVDPQGNAVSALGGQLRRNLEDGRIPRSELDLVTHAGRHGNSSEIKSILAEEDLQYRRDNDGLPLERLFAVNVYYDSYLPLALDSEAEAERLRSAGVAVPGPQ